MKNDALDRFAPSLPPPERALDGFLRRRDRKRRNEKIGAIVLVVVLTAASIAAALAIAGSRSVPQPADQTITTESAPNMRRSGTKYPDSNHQTPARNGTRTSARITCPPVLRGAACGIASSSRSGRADLPLRHESAQEHRGKRQAVLDVPCPQFPPEPLVCGPDTSFPKDACRPRAVATRKSVPRAPVRPAPSWYHLRLRRPGLDPTDP